MTLLSITVFSIHHAYLREIARELPLNRIPRRSSARDGSKEKYKSAEQSEYGCGPQR